MDWLYRFTMNNQYPDPLEEIDALCMLDSEGEPTFLLLADRQSPPLSGSSCGEVVGLCTSQGGQLVLHGTALVAGECLRGDTPLSVRPIYGGLAGRVFCPLKDVDRLPSDGLPASILSHTEQKTFLKGQSFVKRLGSGAPSIRRPATASLGGATAPLTTVTFPTLVFPHKLPAFTVVGLDPTAGTWESKMTVGPKEMPSFALRWEGDCFRPEGDPLAWHLKNEGFRCEAIRRESVLTCLDGPCGTNGPRLLADLSGWDANGSTGTRGGELLLSRQGVNLFWTTQNTVMKFDGASRWIARSLVLFSEDSNQRKIETHPHGAFTFLWQLFGGRGALPKKSKSSGRRVRLAILRSFITGLSDSMVPNHDALDAACAALVAGLHHLGLTIPFGNTSDGGELWMPDRTRLAAFMSFL
ncbi:MAG: hypothetical protein JWN86_1401 [Planctomycetota bacterium]|nr:hypothetical protein [Planctomycetota bacterium]